MAEALVTLLMIGGLFGVAAGLVEGYCALRDRLHRRWHELHEDDWCGEYFGAHRW